MNRFCNSSLTWNLTFNARVFTSAFEVVKNQIETVLKTTHT